MDRHYDRLAVAPRTSLTSHRTPWLVTVVCAVLGTLLIAAGAADLIGFLLRLVALPAGLAALVMTSLNAGKMRCPDCQSRVPRQASVCRYCGRALRGRGATTPA